MQTQTTIEITGDSARLTIEVYCRSHPNAADYWDGNWLTVGVKAETTGFCADFPDSLHLSELQQFHQALTSLYQNLDGQAELNAMDGFLELKAKPDPLGHVLWSVDLTHPAGWGAQLHFELPSDQSYLPGIISQIKAVLKSFPFKGQPE